MILFVYLEYKSNKCETKTFLCNAYFLPKNLVGTNKGQSGPIRDSWCFLKKISVPYCPAVLYTTTFKKSSLSNSPHCRNLSFLTLIPKYVAACSTEGGSNSPVSSLYFLFPFSFPNWVRSSQNIFSLFSNSSEFKESSFVRARIVSIRACSRRIASQCFKTESGVEIFGFGSLSR